MSDDLHWGHTFEWSELVSINNIYTFSTRNDDGVIDDIFHYFHKFMEWFSTDHESINSHFINSCSEN